MFLPEGVRGGRNGAGNTEPGMALAHPGFRD